MPTTINFTLEDAISACRAFHCLPDDTEISIEGVKMYSDVFQDVYNKLVNVGSLDQQTTQKIPAIKAIRDITGLGLKNAKHIVDGITDQIKKGISFDYRNEMKGFGVTEADIIHNCQVNNIKL